MCSGHTATYSNLTCAPLQPGPTHQTHKPKKECSIQAILAELAQKLETPRAKDLPQGVRNAKRSPLQGGAIQTVQTVGRAPRLGRASIWLQAHVFLLLISRGQSKGWSTLGRGLYSEQSGSVHVKRVTDCHGLAKWCPSESGCRSLEPCPYPGLPKP